jgi:hypothetical protein
VLEAVFVLLEFPSPSRRIFIGSLSLPPSLVRRIGPSGGRLRDGVGGEVVQLHPIVVAQPPHEPARGGLEAALVHADEADNVTWGRVGLPV